MKTLAPAFISGIDANHWLYLADPRYRLPRGIQRAVPPERVAWTQGRVTTRNPLELFRRNGVNGARVLVHARAEGLEYAAAVAAAAVGLDMDVVATLSLTSRLSASGDQPWPRLWRSRNCDGIDELVHTHCRQAAATLRDGGFRPSTYSIGNEVELGLLDATMGKSRRRQLYMEMIKAGPGGLRADAVSALQGLWRRTGEFIALGAAGVREVRSDARFALHFGLWWDRRFVAAAADTILGAGAPVDEFAISYYPAAFAGDRLGLKRLEEAVAWCHSSGLGCRILEYAYPANSDLTGSFFPNWTNIVDGHPHTPAGQAAWVKGFLNFCRGTGVAGAYWWSPELWQSPWQPFTPFDTNGRARPAIREMAAAPVA